MDISLLLFVRILLETITFQVLRWQNEEVQSSLASLASLALSLRNLLV